MNSNARLNIDKYIYTDIVVNRLAETIDSPNNIQILEDLMKWVKVAVRYEPDRESYGFDYIQPPSVTVRVGKGDCQDITALIASVLNHLNIPVRLVKAEVSGDKNHIWAEVSLSNKIYMLDGANNMMGKVKKPTRKTYKDTEEIDSIIAVTEWL